MLSVYHILKSEASFGVLDPNRNKKFKLLARQFLYCLKYEIASSSDQLRRSEILAMTKEPSHCERVQRARQSLFIQCYQIASSSDQLRRSEILAMTEH